MYLTGTPVALVRSCSASARSSYVAQRDAFGKKLVSFVPCRVQPGEQDEQTAQSCGGSDSAAAHSVVVVVAACSKYVTEVPRKGDRRTKRNVWRSRYPRRSRSPDARE